MTEEQIVAQIRTVIHEAIAERRGLVAFTKLEALEMDRLARKTEREALARAAALLPEVAFRWEINEIRDAIAEMERQLAGVDELTGIRDASRALARDEVIWQTFERVAQLLGLSE
ncbi:MAG: hypothetical protein QN163_01500 [Armatimonadota bacterium]|nr:hypothetical protein [Armatimonadota bacterium]MDR5696339.1 hypothetical protein [Armatimonadota bacterium]